MNAISKISIYAACAAAMILCHPASANNNQLAQPPCKSNCVCPESPCRSNCACRACPKLANAACPKMATAACPKQSTAVCPKLATAVCPKQSTVQCKIMNQKQYVKKYTNADFYTNGKFNEAVAMKAMNEMLAHYGEPITPFMEKEMWVTDFGMGDFENAGMGGIFWVNDKEHGYFAHEIYLLPGQMIPEHGHVKTDAPAKFESWMVRHGWCYNFSEVGDATPNPPALPESQKATVRSKNFVVQKVGDIVHLKKIETFHFLKAGPHGAIVSEWASYHDNAGLRFTNPKAKM